MKLCISKRSSTNSSLSQLLCCLISALPSKDVASDTYLEESGGRRLRRGGKRGHHGRQATSWGSPWPEDPQITSTPPSASPFEDVAGDAFPEDNGRHLQRRGRRGGRQGGRRGGRGGYGYHNRLRLWHGRVEAIKARNIEDPAL